MYKNISTIGKIVGYFICSLTIEGIDLTDSFVLNWFVISPIISWCLIKLSYYTCNLIVYQKLNINEPAVGSFVYWIFYIIYVLILFGVLSVLKNNGIIPIVTNLDIIIFESVVNFITNIFMESINNIICQKGRGILTQLHKIENLIKFKVLFFLINYNFRQILHFKYDIF